MQGITMFMLQVTEPHDPYHQVTQVCILLLQSSEGTALQMRRGILCYNKSICHIVRREGVPGRAMLLWVSASLQQRIYIWLQSGDEGVALESCEFWSAFCEAAVSQPDRLNPEVLRPFLGRLVPVLLKNMVRTICATPVLQTSILLSLPLVIGLASSARGPQLPHQQDTLAWSPGIAEALLTEGFM